MVFRVLGGDRNKPMWIYLLSVRSTMRSSIPAKTHTLVPLRSHPASSPVQPIPGIQSCGTSIYRNVILYMTMVHYSQQLCIWVRAQAHGAWISFPLPPVPLLPPFFLNFHINHSFFKIFIIYLLHIRQGSLAPVYIYTCRVQIRKPCH